MKRLITITLFIFWAAVVAILVVGLVFYQNSKISGSYSSATNNSQNNSSENNLVSSSTKASNNHGTRLSLSEISKHNSASDCWLLINNKVYNVSAAISAHPGGAQTILSNCGKESTQAFNTKEIGRPHSANASSMLDSYYIGNLDQVINGSQSSTRTVNSQPATSQIPQASPTLATPQTITNTPNATVVKTNATGLSLNMTEIIKHNSRSDCWLLISGRVYNITSYIVAHPGGASIIVSTCGTDATQAYNTKNGAGPHSGNAHSLLAAYYIGDLNQQTTTQQVQQNIQTTNAVIPPSNRGRDGGEFDD